MMFDRHKIWQCLVGILLVSAAYGDPHPAAIQPAIVAPFHNGDTLAVTLSTQDPNRLRVIGDHIAGVVCPPEHCRATVSPNDPSQSAYLTINPADKRAFTVHLSTLQQRYFSLTVTPTHQAGATLLFEPQSAGISSQLKPLSEPWVTRLTQLTRAIIQRHPPEGYAVVKPKKTSIAKLADGLQVTPIVSYQGESFTVTHYRLMNLTRHWVTLHAPQFYQVGVVAVALSSETLCPHAQATLYQITLTGGAV